MLANRSERAIAPLTLLVLASCGTFGLDQKADTAPGDSGAARAPLRLEALVPDWAPLAGGTEVMVRGAGFEGDVTFSFGNAEVAVTVIDEETLVVVTPEVRAEATVDVEVESSLGRYSLEDAFTFSDEPGGDGGG
ncbi:MAG: IPT/TIG domain-containing protein, partial [Myxococcota bacterium]|nr:IPT/TIG domain-containing protein [Myxococcota bacterium]